MDWPTAFAISTMIVAVIALIGYQDHLRAEVMKEALRQGATEITFEPKK